MKSLLFTGVSRAGMVCVLGRAHRGDERVHDRLDPGVLGDRLEAEDDTMPEHPVRERLDVLRHDVVAAGEEGAGAGCLGEGDAAAWAGPELDVPGQLRRDVRAGVPRDVDDADGVADDRRVQIYPPGQLLEAEHVVDADYGLLVLAEDARVDPV